MKTKDQSLNEFLTRFPIGKLKDMTLEEYTGLKETGSESFCRQLTSENLVAFGGINPHPRWFRIYQYNKRPEGRGMLSDETYAWEEVLGFDRTHVFAVVKSNLVRLAELAQAKDIDAIENFQGFCDIIKWRIAFVYSNKYLLPIYMTDKLAAAAKVYGCEWADPETSTISALQKFLIEKRDAQGRDTFEFYESLIPSWEEDENTRNGND